MHVCGGSLAPLVSLLCYVARHPRLYVPARPFTRPGFMLEVVPPQSDGGIVILNESGTHTRHPRLHVPVRVRDLCKRAVPPQHVGLRVRLNNLEHIHVPTFGDVI